MSATLMVKLDSEVLHLAEQEAKARHTTLPEVIAQSVSENSGMCSGLGRGCPTVKKVDQKKCEKT